MKRFEEIKKLHAHFACGHEEIDDLIQMLDKVNAKLIEEKNWSFILKRLYIISQKDLQKYLEEEKEKNVKLERELNHKNELIKQTDKDLENEYVHKNKIKEKLRELDKNEHERINKIKNYNEMFPNLIYISNKKILEQLLKEGEENV